jgi:hypothetical protein
MIMYRIRYGIIKPVEITRRTAKCVWLADGNRREHISTMTTEYYDNWSDAHAQLINRAANGVCVASCRLKAAVHGLECVKGLINPQLSATEPLHANPTAKRKGGTR